MQRANWGRMATGSGRLLAAALLAGALLAAGCLEDAQDTKYDYSNSADPSPADSSTSSNTSEDQGNVAIVHLSTINEVVVVANSGTIDVILTDWTLRNDTSGDANDVFSFPSFTLGGGQWVRVHSATGSDDADDLYWDGGGHWAPGDTVLLTDNSGSPIDSCSDGEACWDE